MPTPTVGLRDIQIRLMRPLFGRIIHVDCALKALPILWLDAEKSALTDVGTRE